MVHCHFVKAGGHTAKEVLGLGDGSPWVWNTIAEVAPTAIQILDFMHLMGYIHDAAGAGYGVDNKLRHAFADRMETALKESQIDHVLQKLEALPSRKKSDREVIGHHQPHFMAPRRREGEEMADTSFGRKELLRGSALVLGVDAGWKKYESDVKTYLAGAQYDAKSWDHLRHRISEALSAWADEIDEA